MENASKALLIAGSILIAMITISVFYFMFGQISEFSEATETDTSQEELLAFNQGFEAYNKKLMYGADVISVINKAIDNNEKYDVENDTTNDYYVDIAVTLKKPLYILIETYTYNKNEGGYDKIKPEQRKIYSKISGSKSTISSFTLAKDKESIIENILINEKSVEDEEGKSYDQASTAVTEYTSTGYTVTTYPATEFKRRIFYCTGVEYSKVGRVCKMTFTEKDG